jgi:hypothetical protein
MNTQAKRLNDGVLDLVGTVQGKRAGRKGELAGPGYRPEFRPAALPPGRTAEVAELENGTERTPAAGAS